jgi:hypothetical protein
MNLLLRSLSTQELGTEVPEGGEDSSHGTQEGGHAEEGGHGEGEGHHINEFGVMLYIILFMMSIFNISSAYFAKNKIHFVHETSVALILGTLVGIFAFYWKNSIFSLDEQMFFYILLPPIIFAEGFNIEKERFFKIFGYAVLYGALGTSLNFIFISLCNNYMNDFDYIKITHDVLEVNIGNIIKFDSYDILLLSTVLSAKDSFAISTMIDHHKYILLYYKNHNPILLIKPQLDPDPI